MQGGNGDRATNRKEQSFSCRGLAASVPTVRATALSWCLLAACPLGFALWPLHERWEVYYNQQDPIQTEACIHMLFTDAQCTQGCTAMTGLRPLLLPLGSSPALLHLFVLPHRQRQTTHTRGMPGLAMDSGLDAFSQYPSLGSFTAPASRLTVEARAVA